MEAKTRAYVVIHKSPDGLKSVLSIIPSVHPDEQKVFDFIKRSQVLLVLRKTPTADIFDFAITVEELTEELREIIRDPLPQAYSLLMMLLSQKKGAK